jgi:hypothetical protein
VTWVSEDYPHDLQGDQQTFTAQTQIVVQKPTSVTYVNTLSRSGTVGSSFCSSYGGGSGYLRNVTLQLLDQGQAPIRRSNITVADTITPGGTNALGLSSQTGSTTTNNYGQWPDSYFVCSTLCPASSGQTNATQSWTANSASLSVSNNLVYKCGSITIDGN